MPNYAKTGGECHVTGHVVLWMLSCNRCCPVVVVMSQDTLSYGCCYVTGHSPLFYYLKIFCPLDVVISRDMLSYRCCHVTGHSPLFYYLKICCPVIGHIILWMLSCHRTLPRCFIMRIILYSMLSCDRTRCPVDGVMSQDTPTPVLLLLKT